MLDEVGADIGLVDGGAVLTNFPAGDITFAQVEAFVSGGSVRVVRLTGAALVGALAASAASLGRDEFFPSYGSSPVG